jgi:hypothetical protein
MAAKKNYKATRDFTFGDKELKDGDVFTIPDDWELDKTHNAALQSDDKKAALRNDTKYEAWRTAFIQAIPVSKPGSKPGETKDGVAYKRYIYPVI